MEWSFLAILVGVGLAAAVCWLPLSALSGACPICGTQGLLYPDEVPAGGLNGETLPRCRICGAADPRTAWMEDDQLFG